MFDNFSIWNFVQKAKFLKISEQISMPSGFNGFVQKFLEKLGWIHTALDIQDVMLIKNPKRDFYAVIENTVG